MAGDKGLLDVKTENKVLLDVEYVKKKYVVTSIYDIWGREVLPQSGRPLPLLAECNERDEQKRLPLSIEGINSSTGFPVVMHTIPINANTTNITASPIDHDPPPLTPNQLPS